jgi:hypothetical protein
VDGFVDGAGGGRGVQGHQGFKANGCRRRRRPG